MRVSLQDTNIKVIEVYPPAVQTELHDERHQPDIKNGRDIGMPLDDFTQAVRRLVDIVADSMLTMDRLGLDLAKATKTYLLA